MNQKGFITAAWAIIVFIFAGAAGYLVVVNKPILAPAPAVSDQFSSSRVARETLAQSGKFKTYSLDVSAVASRESGFPATGNLIISHNAAAVFPLDLGSEFKKVTETSPATIFEAQTKSGCWNQNISPSHEVTRSINASGPLQPKNVGNVRKIILEMPYRASQDAYTRRPGAFCFGLHAANNTWTWNTAPVRPALDDNAHEGRGEIALDAKDVDGIAILFDSATNIKSIRFEAEKIR